MKYSLFIIALIGSENSFNKHFNMIKFMIDCISILVCVCDNGPLD